MLTHPLRKDHLRVLLLQEASRLTPSAERKAIEWAIVANLMDKQGLTIEGKLVATKDPYLETTVTDWLIHFHLSSGDCSLWKDFVHVFLLKHSTFTQDELLKHFTSESPNELLKNVRLLLKTYLDPQAISNSNFLTQEEKRYSTGNANLSNPYTTGYFLAKIWERDFRSQSVVFVDQIVDAEMGLSHILGINSEKLRQQLDILAKHEMIEQRSTNLHIVGTRPQLKEDSESYQVHRCWETAAELLEKAYEDDMATPNRPLIQSLDAFLKDDDDVPDFSQFIDWASKLVALDGASNTMVSVAS